MSALGAQGRTALREQSAIRLVTDTPAPETEPAPDSTPLGVPAIAAVRLASDRAAERRVAELAELATLRERVTDLQAEVAHLHRQIERAREAGRRDGREVEARTMGGKVLSIFVGGDR